MENSWVFGTLFALGFLVFFACLWWLVTNLLVRMAGWSKLEQAFPDQPHDQALEKWSAATAAFGRSPVGGVNFRNSLVMEACHSGLRIKIWRIMAPSAAPIFIPWSQLGAEPGVLGTTLLPLGSPEVGCLRVRTKFAQRVAAASRGQFSVAER